MDVSDISMAICFMFAIIFVLLSILFALLKEKAAMLISGFNTMPKKQREEYDTVKLSKDMRNQFARWALVLLLGGILSYLLNFYFAVIALIIWVVLFFKDVHLNIDKAFGKYRK